MASPKALESYPNWFIALANEFEPGLAHDVAIKSKVYLLPDQKAALRLRQQLYGFLRAIRREAASMYPHFLTVRIVIEANELHILHVDKFIPQPPEKPHE